MHGIVRNTLHALVLPRRLVPILLVCAPLVAAQGSFSADPLAVPLAVLTCIAFVCLGPLSWRVLFADDREPGQDAVRLLLYAGVGAGVVLTAGLVLPKLLGMGATFLTTPASLAVSGALFLAGGWGLGRDIGLEASLLRERARAEALAREAEQAQLLALRAHLDPHFLFNTLNAIAEWCREDGEVAERAVLQLSSILRTVLAGVKAPSWPLEREVALASELFSLHRMRHPFDLQIEVPADLHGIAVPPLILLPLAENACKHGPGAGNRGPVRLSVELGERVHVRLENPGVFAGRRPGGEGLAMVERRLALAYGSAASLRIASEGGCTVALVVLPLARSEAA